MKLRIIRACCVGGQPLEAGKVLDIDEKTGRELLNLRRAELIGETVVEVREPAITTRDPITTEDSALVANKPKRGRPPKV